MLKALSPSPAVSAQWYIVLFTGVLYRVFKRWSTTNYIPGSSRGSSGVVTVWHPFVYGTLGYRSSACVLARGSLVKAPGVSPR